MHILVACDQNYYDKWACNLLKSIQHFNSHPWLSLHCHIVNPKEERRWQRRLEGVNYTTEKYDNVSIPYLQAVRFLIAAQKFKNDEHVMILDADSICTREFTQQEFIDVTSDVTVLKHHKELAFHPWLCGFVTLGNGMFRQDYANNLLITKSKEWEYGHDQDILNLLYHRHQYKTAPQEWICMGKQNPKSVFLTLKGDKHKKNPKYTEQLKRYIVQ